MIRRSCYSRYRTRLDWMAPRSTPKTPCSRAPIKLIFELGVDSGYTKPLPGSGRRSRGELEQRSAHVGRAYASCFRFFVMSQLVRRADSLDAQKL